MARTALCKRVNSMRVQERAVCTVRDRSEHRPLRKSGTRRDPIPGSLSRIDPMKMGARGARIVKRGSERQIQGKSKATRCGGKQVRPFWKHVAQ